MRPVFLPLKRNFLKPLGRDALFRAALVPSWPHRFGHAQGVVGLGVVCWRRAGAGRGGPVSGSALMLAVAGAPTLRVNMVTAGDVH